MKLTITKCVDLILEKETELWVEYTIPDNSPEFIEEIKENLGKLGYIGTTTTEDSSESDFTIHVSGKKLHTHTRKMFYDGRVNRLFKEMGIKWSERNNKIR